MKKFISLIPFLSGIIMCFLISSCSKENIDVLKKVKLPEHYVLVSTFDTAVISNPDVSLKVFRSDSTMRWRVEDFDDATFQFRRTRTYVPPGISANDTLYLAAWWSSGEGADAVVHLNISVSPDGAKWSIPKDVTVLTPGLVEKDSRPSVAYNYKTGRWFVACKRKESTADTKDYLYMNSFKISLSDTGKVMKADISDFRFTKITDNLNSAPAICYFNDSILVAYSSNQNNTYALNIIRTRDGSVFTAPQKAVNNSGIEMYTPFYPYLNYSLGGLYLATANETSGTIDINIWESENGIHWTRINNLPHVSSASFRVDPSIAGPKNEMIIVYQKGLLQETTVNFKGVERQVNTGTNRSVSSVFGP